jgi:hypothetical protein
MYVDEMVRQCVLFLGNKDEKTGKFIPRATAFVVALNDGEIGFRYVVTAEHNISGFRILIQTKDLNRSFCAQSRRRIEASRPQVKSWPKKRSASGTRYLLSGFSEAITGFKETFR